MLKSTLQYKETGHFSKFIHDYTGWEGAIHKYAAERPSTEAIQSLISKKTFSIERRQILARVLRKQAAAIAQNEITGKQIELILNENTFTVTTAHQPNLLLGPLYTIYKTISAISLSRSLKLQFPHQHFIPVFWIGSEDHDLAELNHISIQGEKWEWKTNQTGSFGRMKMEAAEELLKFVAGSLHSLPYTNELIEVLKASYADNRTMALCFQTLLYKLFGEQGLLVLDGDDAELKKIFVPVMKEELIRQPSAGVLNVSNEKFRLDYPLQVSHREINLFYLTGESRSRLVKTDAGFATADGKLNFTGAECLNELENSPERFSPNVILRPLYQNMVLPDVAFTGGPAEVVYFFQIKKVFEEFRIDFPVVFLRSCALLISEKQSDRIRKLQWSDSMIFQKTETLLNTYLQSVNGNVAALSTEFELLGELFNGILKKAAEVDGTLHAAVEAEKTRALKGLQMIDEKIKRALKRKHDEQLQRVRKLKEDLFPGEGLQERKESFLSYYATYGPNLLQELLQHLNPLDQQFTILRLE